MLTLSIQQPWSSAIIFHGKDIENRSWFTNVRGRVLVHAGKKIDDDLPDILMMYPEITPQKFETGGIIGSVEIVDCVEKSDSKWFFGRYGFVLRNPVAIPFYPCRGQLGFFNVEMGE
jgi:hypothetical protein